MARRDLVKLRASVNDKKAQLRPGMFVNVSVVLPERANVVFVPATAIMRAPYGNSIYIVEDRKDDKGRPVNGPDGKPNTIPGHSIPLAQLGCFILLFGWFGFNAASTLSATDLRFTVVAVNTAIAAAFGATWAAARRRCPAARRAR